MRKKFNNIKPGTICTLVHNDSLIFRITHINESGFPFAMHSLYCYPSFDEFQIDKKPICMAYTTEYKEATEEQKKTPLARMTKGDVAPMVRTSKAAINV